MGLCVCVFSLFGFHVGMGNLGELMCSDVSKLFLPVLFLVVSVS